MRSNGVWKCNYRGVNVYWDGQFHTGGQDGYGTITACKAAIDAALAIQVDADAEMARQRRAGSPLKGTRHADGRVTVDTPRGVLDYADIRAYRRDVFRLESEFDADVCF